MFVVVPQDYSDNDIENLVRMYSFQAQATRGGMDCELFLKSIAKAMKIPNWQANYVIQLKVPSRRFKIM